MKPNFSLFWESEDLEYIFTFIGIVILFPILYFLPKGYNIQGTLYLLLATSVVAFVSLYSLQSFPLWQSAIILASLSFFVTFLLSQNLASYKKDAAHKEYIPRSERDYPIEEYTPFSFSEDSELALDRLLEDEIDEKVEVAQIDELDALDASEETEKIVEEETVEKVETYEAPNERIEQPQPTLPPKKEWSSVKVEQNKNNKRKEEVSILNVNYQKIGPITDLEEFSNESSENIHIAPNQLIEDDWETIDINDTKDNNYSPEEELLNNRLSNNDKPKIVSVNREKERMKKKILEDEREAFLKRYNYS